MGRAPKSPRITAGTMKGRPLSGGIPGSARPTSSRIREALGSLLGPKIQGAYILDAFAGSGILSMEALSRGAERVLAFEISKQAIASIQKTVADLQVEPAVSLRSGDVLRFLSRNRNEADRQFDIVFVDPPYQSDLAAKTIRLLVRGDWLHPESLVIVESSKRSEPSATPSGLAILDARRYGDTQITIYGLDKTDGQEPGNTP